METYIYKWRGEEIEIERYTKDRIDELKERVKKGNDKLMAAWAEIVKQELGKYETEIKKWTIAQARLMEYCRQLQDLGFHSCLYIENGKKTKKCIDVLGCIVCPSDISYWETEVANNLWDDLQSASRNK